MLTPPPAVILDSALLKLRADLAEVISPRGLGVLLGLRPAETADQQEVVDELAIGHGMALSGADLAVRDTLARSGLVNIRSKVQANTLRVSHRDSLDAIAAWQESVPRLKADATNDEQVAWVRGTLALILRLRAAGDQDRVYKRKRKHMRLVPPTAIHEAELPQGAILRMEEVGV